MTKSPSFRTLLACAVAVAAGASAAAPALAETFAFDSSEAAFDAMYDATSIALSGSVVDEAGAPIAGAVVTTAGFGEGALSSGVSAVTDAAGAFTLPALARRSVLLRIEHAGHYTEVVAADLHRPLSETTADAGVAVLSQKKAGRARILVAGDTMLGRRFVDSDGDGIEGEAGDLIRPATRAEDAAALFDFMRDVLSSADYAQVNLECPVTDDPATPHPYKSYTFFSYPETIGALASAGIDGVTLGNNHVYDYLEAGLSDTLSAVPAAGLDWFGAGMNESLAQGTVLYRTLGGGVDVAFQGFDQLVNSGTTLPEYTLVAHDAPGEKGGALEMSSQNMSDFLALDAPDRFSIPVLHGGIEYMDYPSPGMRQRFVDLVTQGAGVVVAHHPHTIHGVGLIDAGAGPRFVFMSLGNLIFDQDVFETFQSFLAEIDVDQTGAGAYAVHRVQLVPYHIEGYVPKLVAGAWRGRAARHIGHLSTTLPAAADPADPPDGITGAVVFPAGGRAAVAADASGYQTSESVDVVAAPVSGLSTGAVAVARSGEADMLAALQTSAPAACEVGREIGLYGDFEDGDVDDGYHEGALWYVTSYHPVQNSVVHSGTGAMVLLRKSTNSGSTSTYMPKRVRFAPGRSLTLQGYVKGSNAGTFKIQVYWYDADGNTLSNSYVYTRSAGTYDWERFQVHLSPPAGAGSLRAYYRAYKPSSGEANTFLDDIDLIEWEDSTADATAGMALPTPNNWSFVRCTTADPGLTSVDIALTHRAYTLAAVTP